MSILSKLFGEDADEQNAEAKLTEVKKEAADAAYDEGKAVGITEGQEAGKAEQAAEVEALQAKLTAAEEAKAEAEQKATDAEAKAAEAEGRVAALTPGFDGGGDGADEQNGVQGTYWDVVDQKMAADDKLSKDLAMLLTQREHPELHKAMLAESNK